jgi:hypothetical protein
MLLCDWAEAVNGKLYAQGGGWTHLIMPTERPRSMAVGLVIAVPWNDANQRFPLELRLQTEDGEQVSMGDQEVKAPGQIEVGRPAGVKPGSDLNAVLAYNFHGLVLPAGGYVWRLTIGDEPSGRTPFWVLTAKGGD